MFTCPCCGYKTFDENPLGTFDICSLCGWEVDTVQSTDPGYEGGPNGISMREHQDDFYKDLENDNCAPKTEKDKNWVRLSPPKSKEFKPENVKTDYIIDSDGNIKDADA